jgi:hypothetical protein
VSLVGEPVSALTIEPVTAAPWEGNENTFIFVRPSVPINHQVGSRGPFDLDRHPMVFKAGGFEHYLQPFGAPAVLEAWGL